MNRAFRPKALLVTLIFISFSAWNAAAQQQFDAVMSNMSANAKQLKQYTFKQRSETYYKGELKSTRLDEIHYDSRGERVSIPLSQERAHSQQVMRGPMSRIIAKKVESKQEEIAAYIERLMSLTGRYLNLDPATLQMAMSKAEVKGTVGSSEVRVTMRSVIRAGDMVAMTFNAESKSPTKTEIAATLDGDPVNIAVAFDRIREGPSYPARILVNSDAEQVQVRVLAYDHHR